MREWIRNHKWWTVAFAIVGLGWFLTIVDPPVVENVVPALNTDSAVAGPQYKYKCRLPQGIERSIAGDWGYSSWQPSINLAKRSAFADATDGRYRVTGPDYVYGSFTLVDHRGREAYVIPDNCRRTNFRIKSGR